jgi:uncharacterized SAM-binding protein YcdF (DUF218 family)
MHQALAEFRRQMLTPGVLTSLALAALTAALGLGLPVVWRWRQVVATARREGAAAADAILVVGRALVADQPTRVFVARLNHGLELFRQGLAPRIVIAGGVTGTARRSEAEAGREYLLAAGAAAEALHLEDQSRHTMENLINTRETLRRAGWRSLIVVSDPLHLARIGAFARGLGLECHLSPAHAAPPTPGSLGWHLRALREACLLHWYHVGMTYSRALGSRQLLDRVT